MAESAPLSPVNRRPKDDQTHPPRRSAPRAPRPRAPAPPPARKFVKSSNSPSNEQLAVTGAQRRARANLKNLSDIEKCLLGVDRDDPRACETVVAFLYNHFGAEVLEQVVKSQQKTKIKRASEPSDSIEDQDDIKDASESALFHMDSNHPSRDPPTGAYSVRGSSPTPPVDVITQKRSLNVFIGTWNVGGGDARTDSLTSWLFPEHLRGDADMYVLGFQEIVKLDATNMFFRDAGPKAKLWKERILYLLNQNSKSRFVAVERGAHYLMGILLCVFAKEDISHEIRHVSSHSVKTGFGGFAANKGGVGIRMQMLERLARADHEYLAGIFDCLRSINDVDPNAYDQIERTFFDHFNDGNLVEQIIAGMQQTKIKRADDLADSVEESQGIKAVESVDLDHPADDNTLFPVSDTSAYLGHADACARPTADTSMGASIYVSYAQKPLPPPPSTHRPVLHQTRRGAIHVQNTMQQLPAVNLRTRE